MASSVAVAKKEASEAVQSSLLCSRGTGSNFQQFKAWASQTKKRSTRRMRELLDAGIMRRRAPKTRLPRSLSVYDNRK